MADDLPPEWRAAVDAAYGIAGSKLRLHLTTQEGAPAIGDPPSNYPQPPESVYDGTAPLKLAGYLKDALDNYKAQGEPRQVKYDPDVGPLITPAWMVSQELADHSLKIVASGAFDQPLRVAPGAEVVEVVPAVQVAVTDDGAGNQYVMTGAETEPRRHGPAPDSLLWKGLRRAKVRRLLDLLDRLGREDVAVYDSDLRRGRQTDLFVSTPDVGDAVGLLLTRCGECLRATIAPGA